MPREGAPRSPTFVDVLERVLAKGVVIDAQVDISVVGIRLIGLHAVVVVASLETYWKYSDQLAGTPADEQVVPIRSLSEERIVAPPLPRLGKERFVTPPSSASPKPRRPRRHRRAPRVLTCSSGCTFHRPVTRSRRAETVACPYQAGVICPLHLASDRSAR